MKTSETKKTSLLFLVVAACAAFIGFVNEPEFFQPALDNDLTRELKKKLDSWTNHYIPDRIYMQVDKTLYEPGETIWFSTYVCNANTLKPSSNSEIAYVELIGPKGNVEKKLNLICKKGKGSGDFSLAEDVPGGIYKLRAYTNWLKNEDENKVFEKTIQVQDVVLPDLKMKFDFEKKAYGPGDFVTAKMKVQTNENKALASVPVKFYVQISGTEIQSGQATTDNTGELYLRFQLPANLKSNDGLLNIMIPFNGSTESISRSIPIVLNQVSLELFPEGGDLVAGLQNHIAFRAKNEFGKPADVEGMVFDELGKKITSFSSFYNGLGDFVLTPSDTKKYYAKITRPAMGDSIALPQAWSQGLLLHADLSSPEAMALNVISTETGSASIVIQMRGRVIYTTVLNLVKGNNHFSVSTKDFSAGVAQITLFDFRGIERAERLCFVNRDRQLNISVSTDKQKYLPREKVKMSIFVKDEKGLPAPARLSLAVVNDQLLSFSDDKSGNILSKLLLEEELTETIEDPSFYFKQDEKKSTRALDYLLMTSGWRRFSWEKINTEELPSIKYMPEKARLKLVFIEGNTGKPLKDVAVMWNNKQLGQSNDLGKFQTAFVDLSENNNLSFSCEGYYNSNQSATTYSDLLSVTMYKEHSYSEYNVPVTTNMQLANMGAANIQLAPLASFNEQKIHAQVKNVKTVGRKMAKAEVQKPKKEPEALAAAEDLAAAHPKKELMEEVDGEKMDRNFLDDDIRIQQPLQAQQSIYYRARQFPKTTNNKAVPEQRNDFRSTIFWLADLEISHTGKQTVEFFTSDELTSFRTVVEGISSFGMPGRTEQVFYSQLPFSVSCKIPEQIICGDKIALPLVLKNNTSQPIGGMLSVSCNSVLYSASSGSVVQTLMPGEAKTVLMNFEAKDLSNAASIEINFNACGFKDGLSQSIKIAPRGFPVQNSFSSQDLSKEFEVDVDHLVKGSLRASFSAFPNVVTDLLKGVEGILQEPYGCFEQTSCTAYPNAMVLDYLNHTGNKDAKLTARAEDLLNRGYNRLTTFESPGKGYEWFGANPAHEGLTAYGIMEFVDMYKAGQKIDKSMLDRTVKWLMSHRDGKGGFAREQRALHDFGRISDEVMNGYIVYALAEAGYNDFEKEYQDANQRALKNTDAYLMAMNANASFSLGQKVKGDEMLAKLLALQNSDGSIKGATHSITYSQGNSLTIETTALSVMAMINSGHPNQTSLNKAVRYLVSSRSASGVFSSTQGTILALKALTQFAKFSKRTASAGTIKIYVDGKKVAEQSYEAGQTDEILIDQLSKFFPEGKHKIKIEYQNTKEALPYSLAVNWSTTLPLTDAACALQLTASLSKNTVLKAETTRLKIELVNKKNESLPSSILLIGIPAGLSLQPWQLKELQEKATFDYYEIKGNVLAIYYRGLPPSAKINFALDLKADIPGSFDAPASCAYLYYNNENKTWAEPLHIQIH